jgi:hypothetical protein
MVENVENRLQEGSRSSSGCHWQLNVDSAPRRRTLSRSGKDVVSRGPELGWSRARQDQHAGALLQPITLAVVTKGGLFPTLHHSRCCKKRGLVQPPLCRAEQEITCGRWFRPRTPLQVPLTAPHSPIVAYPYPLQNKNKNRCPEAQCYQRRLWETVRRTSEDGIANEAANGRMPLQQDCPVLTLTGQGLTSCTITTPIPLNRKR